MGKKMSSQRMEKLSGRLVTQHTHQPLVGVRVLALDKDMFRSQTLGTCLSDERGAFSVFFPTHAYTEGGLFGETEPDVYLELTNPLTEESVRTAVLPLYEFPGPKGQRCFAFGVPSDALSPDGQTDQKGRIGIDGTHTVASHEWHTGPVLVAFVQEPLPLAGTSTVQASPPQDAQPGPTAPPSFAVCRSV